jgi:type III pantothenate kinase
VGGNAEAVPPEAGILVPPRDPAALAAAVVRLVEDPEAAARMGRAGREHVRREFSVARMAGETAALYEELHGRRHPLGSPVQASAPS